MDAEIRYLEQAFRDNGIVEVRHRIGDRWESGLFNDMGKLLRAVEPRRAVGDLYTSLNRPDRERCVPNAFGPPSQPLSNHDVDLVTRIPLDFDPERPTGTNSADFELKAALECRDQVCAALRACGWPTPALGMSGNGAHALFRCRIKPDAAWSQATGVIYASIRTQFHDMFEHHRVKFDTSVRNPGRIWRLYGSTNRKGAITDERPHRKAEIWIPSTWEPVKASQVNTLVDRWTPKVVVDHRSRERERIGNFRPGRGNYKTLDVVSWFQSHGLYRHHIEDNKHSVRCPWHQEHTSPSRGNDTIVFSSDGSTWPEFFCHHSHCSERRIKDVMSLWGDADQYCSRQMEGRRNG